MFSIKQRFSGKTMFNLELTGQIWTKQSKKENNKTTPHNTDGIIHKLVMVFAKLAPITNPAKTCTRTRAPALNVNPAS